MTHCNFLARNCSRLRSLDVGKCTVTDSCLHCLSLHCLQLRNLSVRECRLITDIGIIFAAEHLPHLQHLNVQLCPGVTSAGCKAVRSFNKICLIEHTNPAL